jgi:hypothetical protein
MKRAAQLMAQEDDEDHESALMDDGDDDDAQRDLAPALNGISQNSVPQLNGSHGMHED